MNVCNPLERTLRLALASEIPTLQALERAADARYAEVGRADLIGDCIPTEVAQRAIQGEQLWICELEDGALAGWALWAWVGDEHCLAQISVDPRYGRRGIGTALLTHGLERARAVGETSVVLTTEREVPWCARWYARHGFVIVPEDAWTPSMREITAQQQQMGLDWSRRVHMRRVLTDA